MRANCTSSKRCAACASCITQIAFPWFDSRRYWDDHVLALREQVALMQEPPLEWLDF